MDLFVNGAEALPTKNTEKAKVPKPPSPQFLQLAYSFWVLLCILSKSQGKTEPKEYSPEKL